MKGGSLLDVAVRRQWIILCYQIQVSKSLHHLLLEYGVNRCVCVDLQCACVCVCVCVCVCAPLCLHHSLSSCCVCVCVLWLSFPVCSRVTQTVPLLPSLEAGPDQLPPRPHCQSIWPIPCCHLPSVIVFGQFRAAI